jgi:hypothetical protein
MLVVGSHTYGSVATGARLAAVVSISTAVFAPLQGQRLDRRGPARGLKSVLWLSTAMGTVVAVGAHFRVATPWIDVAAGGLGLSLAVIPAGFRSLLTHLVADQDLDRASHIDAVGFEISLIGAPLVVAAVAAAASPSFVFAVGSVLTAAGAVIVPAIPHAGSEQGVRLWRQLPAPGIVAAALFLGVSGGLWEPAVFARVEELGRSESVAAVLLAVVGLGSALGGTLAALRSPAARSTTAALLLSLHGIAVLGASLSGQVRSLAVWLFLAGTPIAPLTAVGASLLDRRVRLGERSAALAIAGSAIALGTGIGQALAGWSISTATTTGTFFAAAAVALITAIAIPFSRIRCGR